jgi:hypothetical protein
VEAGLKPPLKSPIEANEEKFVITHFAPAERQSLAEVQASRRRLLATWPVEHLLE